MASERELNILIKARDEASKILKKYEKEFDRMGKGLMAAGAAGAAGLGFAIKTAADFQEQMSKVGAIASATPKQLKALSDSAMKLGASSVYSANEVGAAMEYMAQNGFDAYGIIDSMPGVLDAAAASGMDLASTADLISGALKGFRLNASEAGRVADVLAKVSNTSAADMNSLSYSLKYVAPLAANAGWSIEDVGAALGSMGNQMIKGEQAGTTLRAILLRLQAPTDQAAGALSQLGINVRDAQGNMKSLPEIVSLFQSKLKGLSKAQQDAALKTIVGTEAMSGFQALLNDGGDALKKYGDDLRNSAGSAAETAAKKLDNFKGSLEQMKGALETAAITVGNMFLPGLTKVTNIATDLINKFNNLPDPVKKIAAQIVAGASAFGLIAGAMMIVTPMIPAIGAAFMALFSPIGLVIMAVGLLAAAFATNFGGIRDAVMGWISPIVTAFTYLTGGMDDVVFKGQKMGLDLEQILGTKAVTIVQIVQNMTAMMTQAWTFFTTQILPIVQSLWTQIWGVISVFAQQIQTTVGVFLDQIRAFWAKNGAQIMQNVSATFEIIKKIFTLAAQAITTVINWAFPYIRQIISIVMTQILPILVKTWTVITQTIQKLIPIIVDVIVWAWKNVIKPTIEFVMNYIVPFLVSMFKKIADFISVVMPMIVDVIRIAWDIIKPLFTAALNIIWPIVKHVFGLISTIISSVMDVIFGIIKVVLGLITGHWGKAMDGLVQILHGAFGFIIGLVKNGLGLLWDLFSSIPKMLGGLGGAMLQAGKHLIEGLWNGIKSLGGWIKDKVIGLVTDVLPKAVRKVLGIHSPSRVFMEIGGYTTEGLAKGITDAQNMAKKASIGLAKTVIDPMNNLAFSPSFATASGAGGYNNQNSGGSKTVVVNFHEGAISLPNVEDPKDFAEEFKDSVSHYFKTL